MNLRTARQGVINTLEVICQIDYNYWMLSEIAKNEGNLSAKEQRKYSMGHLRSIIRNKKKLGHDTSDDELKHSQIKAIKC